MKKLILLSLLIYVCQVCGCQESSDKTAAIIKSLPTNVKNIKDIGNDWVEFEYDGNVYLARHLGYQHGLVVKK